MKKIIFLLLFILATQAAHSNAFNELEGEWEFIERGRVDVLWITSSGKYVAFSFGEDQVVSVRNYERGRILMSNNSASTTYLALPDKNQNPQKYSLITKNGSSLKIETIFPYDTEKKALIMKIGLVGEIAIEGMLWESMLEAKFGGDRVVRTYAKSRRYKCKEIVDNATEVAESLIPLEYKLIHLEQELAKNRMNFRAESLRTVQSFFKSIVPSFMADLSMEQAAKNTDFPIRQEKIAKGLMKIKQIDALVTGTREIIDYLPKFIDAYETERRISQKIDLIKPLLPNYRQFINFAAEMSYAYQEKKCRHYEKDYSPHPYRDTDLVKPMVVCKQQLAFTFNRQFDLIQRGPCDDESDLLGDVEAHYYLER